MNRNMLLVLGLGALAFYLWKKSKTGATTAGATPFGVPYRQTPGEWTRQWLMTPNQDTYYDMNQYGGAFVGPRYVPDASSMVN